MLSFINSKVYYFYNSFMQATVLSYYFPGNKKYEDETTSTQYR
jgi:hypothetical protein